MRTLTTFVVLLPLILSGSASGVAGENPRQELKIRLRTAEDSHRGYLGVSIQDMRPARAKEMKLAIKTGAFVSEVAAESPAAEAGIMENDVIVEFNKTTIDDAAELTQAVRKTEPETKTTVTVVRKDQKKSLQVTVGSIPVPHELAMAAEAPMAPMHMRVFSSLNSVNGLTLMELNPQLAEYFGTPAGKGVLVEQVQKRSAAKEAGFKAGDVILKVGDDEIAGVGDVHAAIEDLKDGDSVTVSVLRRGTPATLHMEVDGAPASGFYFRHGTPVIPHVSPDRKVFQLDRMKLQKDLRQLQEELRSVGREIRGKVEKLRNTVKRELRSAMS
jgi:serine protease Do